MCRFFWTGKVFWGVLFFIWAKFYNQLYIKLEAGKFVLLLIHFQKALLSPCDCLSHFFIYLAEYLKVEK